MIWHETFFLFFFLLLLLENSLGKGFFVLAWFLDRVRLM